MAVADSTAEDAAEDVTALVLSTTDNQKKKKTSVDGKKREGKSIVYLVRDTAVRHRKGEGAGVVSEDTVGHVDAVDVLGTNLARVRASTGALLDGLKEVREQVRVVVGHLVLEDRRQALETHAGIDALCGEGLERKYVF